MQNKDYSDNEGNPPDMSPGSIIEKAESLRSNISLSDHELNSTAESKVQEVALEEITYPEGGLKAWSVVAGSFFGLFVSFGTSSIMGTISSHILENQLKGYSQQQVSWIFSLWLFFLFAGSAIIGPLFDHYGVKRLVIPGSVVYIFSLMMVSLCKEYYQFILSFSLLGGISCSIIYNPCVTVIGHWFYKRRAFATGIAFAGAGMGGLTWPLTTNRLFEVVGYGWGIRIVAFAMMGGLIICCFLVDARKFTRPNHGPKLMLDTASFRDKQFMLVCTGVFLLIWGFFIPLNYLVLFAKSHGMSGGTANAVVALLNGCSAVGRVVPGYFGDYFGPYNMAIAMNLLAGIVTLAVWLTVGHKESAVFAYAAFFGFFSGSCLSLIPTCIGRISDTRKYGARFGTCFLVASAAALTGLPIGGALKGDSYHGTIIFAGVCFLVAACFYLAGRLWNGHHQTRYF